jgi:hypothetical protein
MIRGWHFYAMLLGAGPPILKILATFNLSPQWIFRPVQLLFSYFAFADFLPVLLTTPGLHSPALKIGDRFNVTVAAVSRTNAN